MLFTARDVNTPYPTEPVNLSQYIRLARITKVYDIDTAGYNLEEYGKVEIIWLDAVDPNNNRDTISCLTPGASWSRGSGIYRMPHINDVAIVFQRPGTAPIVVGYLPQFLNKALTVDPDSPTEIVGSLPALRSGDILLKSSGQNEVILTDNIIKLITRDASSSATVYTEDIPETTEVSFSRVLGGYNNITSELTLGLSGDTLGAGDVVASLEVPKYSQNIIEIKIEQNAQSTFELPKNYSAVPIKVQSASFIPSTGASTSKVSNAKTLNTAAFRIENISSYTKADLTNSDDTSNTQLTFDTSVVASSLFITDTAVSSVLKTGGRLILSILYREVLGGIKVNNLADCEIDMRNIVFKNKKNVMVGLFDDGSLRTSAATTEIGDVLTGQVKMDAAGVNINAGLGPYATVKNNTEEEDIKNYFTTSGDQDSAGRCYFAISDALPLFYYDTGTKTFDIVYQTEYDALPQDIRAHIPYRNFDDPDSGLFTMKRMQDILNQALQPKEGEAGLKKTVVVYGELRRP